jgi:subtilisin family serine protease
MDRATWADEWFDKRLRVVHEAIELVRKEDDRQVRVAILDTGIDSTHADFNLTESQLEALKSRSKGFPGILDPLKDGHGHGTHVASVLLKTAPHARIYLARVADDAGRIPPDREYESVVQVPAYWGFGLMKGN